MNEFNSDHIQFMSILIMTEGIALLKRGCTPEQAFYLMVGMACKVSVELGENSGAILCAYQNKLAFPSVKVEKWETYREVVLQIRDALKEALEDPKIQRQCEEMNEKYNSFINRSDESQDNLL